MPDQLYTWRYSAAGRRLVSIAAAAAPTGPAQEGQTPTKAVAAAEGTAAAAAEGITKPPTLREAAEFIEQVQAALQRLTGNALTLERLCNEFRLLPTSPAWSAVERALSRLRQNNALGGNPTLYPEVDQDQSNVAEFGRNLESNGAYAIGGILCGLAVGKMSRVGGVATELIVGLRKLNEELADRGVTESNMRRARESLLRSLIHLEEGLSLPLEWNNLETLVQTLESSDSVTLGREKEYVKAVEEEWESRFTQYLRDGKTQFDPIIEEFLSSHYALPALDLRQMSLRDWTQILGAAAAAGEDSSGRVPDVELPPWFAIPTLHALGFSGVAKELGRRLSRLGSLKLSPEVRAWSEFINAETKPGVAVLSLLSVAYRIVHGPGWKPSGRFAALYWESELWDEEIALPLAKLLRIPSESVSHALNIETVLRLFESDEQGLLEAFESGRVVLPPSLAHLRDRTIFVLPSDAPIAMLEAARKSSFLCIFAPRDLDDAMAQVNDMRAQRQDARTKK